MADTALLQQRGQFPELVPTSVGTQWAGVTSGRVLNAKNSTSVRASSQSTRQVWDRVAQAAASSSTSPSPASHSRERFPTLPNGGPSSSSSNTTPFRQGQRNTPWASSTSSSKPPPRGPTSVPGPGASISRPAPSLSKSAFPELPTASRAHIPRAALGGNKSLRKIMGDTTPPAAAWNNGSSTNLGGFESEATPEASLAPAEQQSSGKGKKGKGKQKQTLFTLGSFPA